MAAVAVILAHPSDFSNSSGQALALSANKVGALSPSPGLCLNSGCSTTMVPSKSMLVDYVPLSAKFPLANGSYIRASGSGMIELPIWGSSGSSSITRVHTLHVPGLKELLVSTASLCNLVLAGLFTASGASIYLSSDLTSKTKDLHPLGLPTCLRNLYYSTTGASPDTVVVNFTNTTVELSAALKAPASELSLLDLHIRLGHPVLRLMKRLVRLLNICVRGTDNDIVWCPVCIAGKIHCKPFQLRGNYGALEPGGLIHSDMGSFSVLLHEGYCYFVTFLDVFSKFPNVYHMKH